MKSELWLLGLELQPRLAKGAFPPHLKAALQVGVGDVQLLLEYLQGQGAQ